MVFIINYDSVKSFQQPWIRHHPLSINDDEASQITSSIVFHPGLFEGKKLRENLGRFKNDRIPERLAKEARNHLEDPIWIFF